MCGIAGIVKLKNTSIRLSESIRLMTQAIRHRGPDGEGFMFANTHEVATAGSNETPKSTFEGGYQYSPSKNIEEINNNFSLTFGHRRLSIIDLSPAGHQPMCTPNKQLWITYNGELYNYLELREELKQKGHHFLTQTDTEVILNAYLEWGSDCLSRFNGMWAFVIYDRTKNELFGSRDRFGVKPFYYYRDADVLAFASEQKALVKLPFIKTGINQKAVFDFFVKNEIEMQEEGMFQNILELFPSHAFQFNLQTNQWKSWKYYSLKANESSETFNSTLLPEITERTRQLLVNAVALRLRSDAPIGSCLSGGIDSSSIVGIINHLLSQNASINVGSQLKLFTASFKNPEIDESNWAKMMVDQTKAQWNQSFPTSTELLKDLGDLIYSQDVPIWSTSTYAQYRVMQSAKENGIKVVLDGQGGDELFAGYSHHHLYHWKNLLKNLKVAEALKEMKTQDSLLNVTGAYIKKYLKEDAVKSLPAALQMQLNHSYFNDLRYLNADFLKANQSQLNISNENKINSLNGMLANEFYNTRLKTYLKCEDRCSMWHSVESRTPFADDINLIEYGFQIPGAYKIHNGITKFILREAAQNYIPVAIKNRKDKMGYNIPHNQWITEIKDELQPIFNSDLKDFINVKSLQKEYHQLFNIANQPEDKRIFKFISFAIWKKQYGL
jgi:asparagine synthase (glutamine-hydrolysing)